MFGRAVSLALFLLQRFLLLAYAQRGQQGPIELWVETGLEFAKALATPNVERVWIVNSLVMDDADWSGYTLPVTILRNVTIIGSGAQLPTVMLLCTSPKIILAPGTSFMAQNITVIQNRRALGTMSPGLSLLAPSASADSGSFLVIRHCLLVHSVCAPRDMQEATLRSFTRPASVPGTQLIGGLLEQPANCSNSTAARPLDRCWPRLGWYQDLALVALDPTETGSVRELNYTIHLTDTLFVCQMVMQDSCVKSLGAPGCFLFTYDKLAHVPPPPPPPPPPLYPAAAADSRSPQLSPAAADESGPPLEIILPCAIGGSFLLAVVLIGVVLWRQQRRRRREGAQRQQQQQKQQQQRGKALQGDPASDDVAPSSAATATDMAAVKGERAAPGDKSCESLALAQSLGDKSLALAPSTGGSTETGPPGGKPESSDGKVTSATIVTASMGVFTGSSGLVPEAPVIVTPFTPHRSDLRLLDVQCDTEVKLLPVVRGQGNFGRVVEGVYNGRRVAVKLVPDISQWSGAPRNAFQTYVQEVEVLGRCRHPNVVRLLAACLTPPRLCLVMELMETSLDKVLHGTGPAAAAAAQRHGQVQPQPQPQLPPALCQQQQQQQQQEELQHQQARSGSGPAQQPGAGHEQGAVVAAGAAGEAENVGEGAGGGGQAPGCDQHQQQQHQQQQGRGPLLPLETVLHIATEVARALDYLHPTIVHRDLKPGNVLLNDLLGPRPVVKLTDFGLSRLRSTAQVTKHPEAGTPSYMAPELYDITNAVVTDKTDMYSLGVLLWEMCSGQVPWDGCDALVVAYAVTINRHRLPLAVIPPERRPPRLEKLIVRLWDHDPLRRPAAAEVVKQLTLLQMELARQDEAHAAAAAAAVAAAAAAVAVAGAAAVTPGAEAAEAAAAGGGAAAAGGAAGPPAVASAAANAPPAEVVPAGAVEAAAAALVAEAGGAAAAGAAAQEATPAAARDSPGPGVAAATAAAGAAGAAALEG